LGKIKYIGKDNGIIENERKELLSLKAEVDKLRPLGVGEGAI